MRSVLIMEVSPTSRMTSTRGMGDEAENWSAQGYDFPIKKSPNRALLVLIPTTRCRPCLGDSDGLGTSLFY